MSIAPDTPLPAVEGQLGAKDAPADVEAALQVAVATGLIVAALIHFAVVDIHFQEWVATGLFFVALGVVEVAFAVAILAWRRPGLYRAVLLVTIATLAVWAESRTIGVPIGPEAWRPESIGRPDLISTVAELITGLLLLPVVVRGRQLASTRSWLQRPLAGSTQKLVLAGIIVLAAWLATSGVQSARQQTRAAAAAERAAERAAELNSRVVPLRGSRAQTEPDATAAKAIGHGH